MSRRLIKYIGAIVAMATGGFPGTWLVIQYQKPQIVCYTDEYYSRIGDLLVGSVLVVNEGRSTDSNVTVSIGEKLLTSDVTVGFLSTEAQIVNQGNDTHVTIPKLKPYEYAEIVFRSRRENDKFKVEDVTSESGNIRFEEWVPRSWWNFSKFQLGVLLIGVSLTFGIGFLIGLIRDDVLIRRPRAKRQ
jgi:hypothetical protein